MTINTLNALIEALKAKIPVNKVFISEAKKDHKTGMILDLCRENNVTLQRVPQQVINRKAGPDNQGVFAEVSPIKFYDLDDILRTGKSGLLLILDSINDTGNMGAIIRSAAAADVDGIIISRHNSAPVNETVLKTSAGTLVKVKMHQSRNLNQTVNELKEKGFWIIGADKQGDMVYYNYDFSYKTAIVMGGEHKGISSLLKKNMDHLVTIPHSTQVESLNVSAAAAIILFEALRQHAQREIRP
ncbi:MAG: 23S rRNA (guanosine(2251)-2'-O)-methyltransferase RlmB [Acidobacteria bacterium]|jgi:23S rRNA (guanosine2251-2'-O)-methyltransferase|nr:23S rRNA (guanosine(2251)-2'-O)-methyltransferase RlmB [Acidobacteriota bacterium]